MVLPYVKTILEAGNLLLGNEKTRLVGEGIIIGICNKVLKSLLPLHWAATNASVVYEAPDFEKLIPSQSAWFRQYLASDTFKTSPVCIKNAEYAFRPAWVI